MSAAMAALKNFNQIKSNHQPTYFINVPECFIGDIPIFSPYLNLNV